MACPPQVPISVIPPVGAGVGPLVYANGNQVARLNPPLNPSFVVYDGSKTRWGDGSANAPVLLPNLQQVSQSNINFAVGLQSNGQLAAYANTTIDPNNALVTATGSTTARTLANRFQYPYNVLDYGADPTGSNNSYTAFQNAINALPSGGGTIIVPTGTYLINTQPTWGTKSIFWDIDVNAVFTGTATGSPASFPTSLTNPGNIAGGPWVLSQTTQTPTFFGAAINAATFEISAPSSATATDYVALYSGAQGSNSSTDVNVWALNSLVFVKSGSAGAYFGAEFDVNCFSLNAISSGVLITGLGSQDCDVGLRIERTSPSTAGTSNWFYGITTKKAYYPIYINVDSTFVTGISFSNTSTTFANALFSGAQIANNTSAIVLQRFTDTSSTGSFILCINKANTSVLASIDSLGTVYGANGVYTNGGFLRVNNFGNTSTLFNVSQNSINCNLLQGSTSYANDTAAAAGGVVVGQFYRNGSVVQIRIS